jgi:hypothetical protein
MKNIQIVLALLLSGSFYLTIAQKSEVTSFRIEVKVDPRIELFSTIFRLADLPEYCQNELPEYVNDVELYFNNFKDHSVVKFARQLDTTIGMGYNAPMELAVHISDIEWLQMRETQYPIQEYHDVRWDQASVDKFLKLAHDFAQESHFMDFFNNHRHFYEFTENKLNKLMKENDVWEWLQSFFDPTSNTQFFVLIGMQNGANNYSCQVILSNGKHEVYSIPGVWMKSAQNKPAFNQYTINRIVHEFSHSFINPLVLNSADELENAGKTIYAYVEDDMEREKYRFWTTMIYESIVRACEIRFNNLHADSAMMNQLIEGEIRYGFLWMRKLVCLLEKHENQRNKYPTFESFFPEIITFFNNYTRNIVAEIDELRAAERKKWTSIETNAPKILSMIPENGAKDVDPNLNKILIMFDRPMQNSYGLIMFGSSDNYPEIIGEIRFDFTRTKCSIPVKLKPDKHYIFGLNSEYFMDFRDENNNPLVPVVVKFKTGVSLQK